MHRPLERFAAYYSKWDNLTYLVRKSSQLNRMGSSRTEDEQSERDTSTHFATGWRPVDPEVWTRRIEENRGPLPRLGRFLKRTVSDILSSPLFLLFFAAPAGVLVAFTFFLAYYLGGVNFIGPVFIGVWAFIVLAGIVFLEKRGFSRNFEGWDLPLRRVIILPAALLVAVGFFYFLFFLGSFSH